MRQRNKNKRNAKGNANPKNIKKSKQQERSCIGCIAAALWTTLLCAVFISLFFSCIIAYLYFATPLISPTNVDYFPKGEPITLENVNYVNIGGLNVLTSGDETKEMLIFLHGFPETAALSWSHQISYFQKQNKYFIVAPDQRGYNKSAKYDTGDYNVDNLVADIINIFDHYNKKTVNVVGHDWGGVVSWALAHKHPERVNKLINLNIPHPAAMTRKLRSSLTQLRKSWYIFFFQLPKIAEHRMRRNNFQWLVNALTMAKPKTFTSAMVEQYRQAWAEPNAIEGMLGWYRAAFRGMGTKKSIELNPTIKVPTLLIWGDQDIALDASMAQPSIDFCENGQLKMIPGISHWVQHEAPQQVNQYINEFLNSEQ